MSRLERETFFLGTAMLCPSPDSRRWESTLDTRSAGPRQARRWTDGGDGPYPATSFLPRSGGEMFPNELLARAAAALESCRRAGRRISTAESCTGGLVAGLLTEIAGSSEVFDRAFVTYSNEAKVDMLGVPSSLLAEHGAVSEAVARAMAAGALERSGATVAVSVTGIAGPGGAVAGKPVGLVHFARAREDGAMVAERRVFRGDRTAVRLAATDTALGLLERL